MNIQLCPAQKQAVATFQQQLQFGFVFTLRGAGGAGKSTVLQYLHKILGGKALQIKDLIDRLQGQHPLALEETFDRLIMEALQQHDAVLVDDLHLFSRVVLQSHAYPRLGLMDLLMLKLCTYATEAQKRIIFALDCDYGSSSVLSDRAISIRIGKFTADDYAVVCQQYLDPAIAASLDYEKIHRFAAKLNAAQLKNTCLELSTATSLDTDFLIEHLRSQHLISNVDLGEVQAVDLADLKGVDDVLAALEANLILPLENDVLAKELDLKPKRGVLLAGPPGTGKTSIGRALAHRLKSKFFLVDGTFISGTGDFYNSIHRVFEAAKQNAPSIVFIDDTDVIFEDGEETGLYRYLLTLLDGLESETVGRVCVMMTAMNVANLPPALVRSGRIELWLETRLPAEEARLAILTALLQPLPDCLADVDVAQLVPATAGLTGADLKRLIEDGKMLYAYDRARDLPLRTPTEYFLAAVETVLKNKERYAEAESHAYQHRQLRSPKRAFTDATGIDYIELATSLVQMDSRTG